MIRNDKQKRDTINRAVQQYLSLLTSLKRRRLNQVALAVIFKKVDAPWMKPSMIYQELSRRRRRLKSERDSSNAESDSTLYNIPSDIPLFVSVGLDDSSRISGVSEIKNLQTNQQLLLKDPVSPETIGEEYSKGFLSNEETRGVPPFDDISELSMELPKHQDVLESGVVLNSLSQTLVAVGPTQP
jgi:hypothetical protein